MTNEKRNTAIMAKIERYTQHHTATPDLAQEAIERIAMTKDKDSAVLVEDFEIIVGSKHHETKVSQSELLRLINGGAKIHHIKALRQPAQSDALVAALVEASEGLKQDLLNRAKWAGAWLRFTTALGALQDQSK
jgi:hypothetical protein